MKRDALVQQLVDLNGICIDFVKMKYTPLTGMPEKQIAMLNEKIKELDENELRTFMEKTNNRVSMEINNYKEINKGCLVASFNVLIPQWGLTLREYTLFEKDGKRWVSMPARQYKDAEGKNKNFPLVEFDKDKRARSETACLEKKSQLQPVPSTTESDDSTQLPF